MDSMEKFVEKVHEKQAKDEKNRKTQGQGAPSAKLSTKQHGANP